MTARSGVVAAVLASTLLLGLMACGGNDPTTGPGPSLGPPGTSTDPTPSSTGSSTDPTVAPATGTLVESDHFSMRGPKGFKFSKVSYLLVALVDLLPDDVIYIATHEDYPESDLDALARDFLNASSYLRQPRRMPDTEIDGRPVYHLSGPMDDRKYVEVFGLMINGASVEVSFEFHSDARVRKAAIESVLAGWTWK